MNIKLLYYGFLSLVFTALAAGQACVQEAPKKEEIEPVIVATTNQNHETRSPITIFLTGDVMTGRGIDQVLPFPSEPRIYEPYIQDAKGYVDLAELENGPIPKPVSFSYIWGDALEVLDQVEPDVRIINLETSITTSDDYWKSKGINYRMHPKNVPVLSEAKIDICALANNHVLDWGFEGLIETTETLEGADIKFAGVGANSSDAEAPAIKEVQGEGRVLLYSIGLTTSGIPFNWAATENSPGVNVFMDISDEKISTFKKDVAGNKKSGDIAVASIHWGSNWGYEIPSYQLMFAHRLIDEAGIDIVHGHSSHHVKGVEVYKEKLIIYGAGDFINDYEGIGGYESFRSDLALMYFASVDPATGKLVSLKLTPMQMKNFKLNYVSSEDAKWLRDLLNREGEGLNTYFELDQNKTLILRKH